MPGYHLIQHVYPGQSAGGLHTRVVWAGTRQLHLLRIELKHPLALLWKLVSFKNVLDLNETPNREEEAIHPNWWFLLILNISMTFLLCFVGIIH